VPVDLPWGQGLLALHRGDYAEAGRRLEQALELARERGNHWAAFECLSRRALVDLSAGESGRVAAYVGELQDIADKLGEGSEPALARALTALARYSSDAGAAGPDLTEALVELRARDTKAALATVLNQAAVLDLSSGRRDLARSRAREALAAAEAVGRQRQAALARELIESSTLDVDT